MEDYLGGLRFARGSAAAGLEEAMRYSLLAGGKRIRPVLALATARALGRDPADVLPLAAALELIHTYSLIHDDLPAMDDDDLRRGRATCHVATARTWRSWPATASTRRRSGSCFASSAASRADVLAAVGELAAATGVDGHGRRPVHRREGPRRAGRGDPPPAARAQDGPLDRRLRGMRTPPGRRRDPSPTLTEFRAFAFELGVLFQIVDDILDVTGTDDALGKPQGSDERHGKLDLCLSTVSTGRARWRAD